MGWGVPGFTSVQTGLDHWDESRLVIKERD